MTKFEIGQSVHNDRCVGSVIGVHENWVWVMTLYDGKPCPLTWLASDVKMGDYSQVNGNTNEGKKE